MITDRNHQASKQLKPALILSAISLILMIIQSGAGVLTSGMYATDSVWSRASWHGNDMVTLCIFSPMLLGALVLVIRGSVRGRVLWLGLQALVTYNFIYYALAVVYNQYFLLYVAVLGVSLYSFLFGISSLDFDSFALYKPGPVRRVTVCAIQFLFAGTLALVWIGQAILFITTGQIRQEGLGLISTVDLVIVVPPMILSGVWLLRGESR
ncbi:MAG TPA: hypothetical protein VF857_05880, partial [Spirochaetota bacterium]